MPLLILVVPYIGTWIETNMSIEFNAGLQVVPYIGTWIETRPDNFIALSDVVVPYIGTWIETLPNSGAFSKERSRTLYRYVD